jgi:penicillin amidase
MKFILKIFVVIIAVGAAAAAGAWYIHNKRPIRSGEVSFAKLQAAVNVRYNKRDVAHIQAQNEADMYRILEYVHAQDLLFQMDMLRRLARCELAAIFGPKLLDSDRLFRSIAKIKRHFS